MRFAGVSNTRNRIIGNNESVMTSIRSWLSVCILAAAPLWASAQPFKLGSNKVLLPIPPATQPATQAATRPAVAPEAPAPAADPSKPNDPDKAEKPSTSADPEKTAPNAPKPDAPKSDAKPELRPILFPELKPDPAKPDAPADPSKPATRPQPIPATGAAPAPAIPATSVETPTFAPSKPYVDPGFVLDEFPPGLFSDGGNYRLNDLRGKTIVLFFFDPADARMQATVAQRNATVKKMRDKPVVFFGVQVDTIQRVRSTVYDLGLNMPVFADTLGVMGVRYKAGLTDRKTWSVIVIDGAGKIAHEEMSEASLSKTLDKAAWRYRDRLAVDAKLAPAMDYLEMGDYEHAMKSAASAAVAADKKTVDAVKLFQSMMRADCEQWKADAERLIATDPQAAWDLYARITACFPGSDLAKAVADPMKKLEARKDIRNEIAARYMYDQLGGAVSRNERIEKWDAIDYCDEIVRAHPGTPTADKLVTYLDDLGKVKDRNGAPAPMPGRRRGRFN